MKVNCFALAVLLASLPALTGASTDLAPPSLPGSSSSLISGGAIGDDRGVLIQALGNLTFGGAGIYFDPLAGGAPGIRLSVYSVSVVQSNYVLGGQLYSGTTGIGDVGAAFYNVALNFGLSSGSYYYLAFSSTAGSWGDGLNNMEFFGFDRAQGSSPYTVGGAGGVSVIDGGAFPANTMAGFANTVMPHIALFDGVPPATGTGGTGGGIGAGSGGGSGPGGGGLGGGGQTAVPEPGTWALMLAGVCFVGLRSGRISRLTQKR